MKIIDNKQVAVKEEVNVLAELKNTHELCALLMKTPHYAKMGQEGVFAIVETAKSLGIDPRQALGGGLYFVRGKVEMSARMMNALIRSKKHSITRDKRSDDTICILHGKRADNNDMWSESFSLEEAKKAGLYKDSGPWKTFTRDMLFARALSRLARQLFPDIIGNCYVEGEISLDPHANETVPHDTQTEIETLDDIQVEELKSILSIVPEYETEILDFLNKKGIEKFQDMPKPMFNKILENAKRKVEEAQNEESSI